ncbi:MAG: hypothetical protein J6V87_05055 [Prevotella sp.]|nr:hypothetical protein [Prevotella sp.]
MGLRSYGVKTIVWCLVGMLAFSCSQPELTQEELAGHAAKEYYDRLIAGDYEAFLSGKADTDSLPADYRAQLLRAYELYKQELDQTHEGIAEVTISNARCDSTQQLMHAFLLLHFKDSVKEEITVPMVQREGQWKMR